MTLTEILDSFDKSSGKTFDEHDIASELKQLIPEDKSKVEMDLRAELMAFEFVEDYPNNETSWGTYFGPMFVINNNDGTATESPSIKLVTTEIIEYWTKRAYESQNPILVARYSGLVWDFQNQITGTKPNHKIARLYAQALIDTSISKTYKREVYVFKKIERALEISSALNDDVLIEKCKLSLIAFEKDNSQDSKPGLWGYCYDLLIGNKKVKLSKEEEEAIIIELENKLNRLTTSDDAGSKIDPWAAEAAADRLAQYYSKKNKFKDVRRVILKVGKAFEDIMSEASSMQASGWTEHLYRLYSKFNLKEEAAQALLKIRELGPKVSEELKPISHSMDIPREEIEKYVNSMTDGSIEEFLERFIFNYIPNKEEVKKQLFQLAKAAPFQFMIGQALQDEKGRVVATIGSLENDLEGHIVRQVSQSLTFSSLFMHLIIEKAKERFTLTKSDILKYIETSPIIDKSRFSIIEESLNAYFNNNFLVFTHLVIPQIEEAMRNLVELAGGNVLKDAKRGGGFQLKTFDEILRDSKLVEVVGEDFATYFRILFTDQRGWNLRNNVFHGLANPNTFNNQTGHRLLHSLLCLGLVRTKS
jgi:hypothetical protein